MLSLALSALILAQEVADTAPLQDTEAETVIETDSSDSQDAETAAAAAPPPPPTDAPTLINQINGEYAAYGEFVAELAARKARERYLAELLLPVLGRQDLDAGAHGEILAGTRETIAAVEADNTAWAIAQLDPEQFVILWHDRDREARNVLRWAERDEAATGRIIAALENVAIEGLFDGQDYAVMADNHAVSENRPQPYGTAVDCVDGEIRPWPLDDGEPVDDRRAAIGLSPFEDAWAAYIAVNGTACTVPETEDG